MLDVIGLSAAGAAFFVAAASPGPATIAVANVSMGAGRRAGLRFGLGLGVGLAFWGLVAATGLGALLEASSRALVVMKLVGGAYLLWLAWGAGKSALRGGAPVRQSVSGRGWIRRGVLLNLSNPKAVLAWMATLALGLGDSSGAAQVALATGLCMGLGMLIYAAYAMVFSTSGAMSVYSALRRWIDGVVAGLFALSGLALIRSALARA